MPAALIIAAFALQGMLFGLYEFLQCRPGSIVPVSIVRWAVYATGGGTKTRNKAAASSANVSLESAVQATARSTSGPFGLHLGVGMDGTGPAPHNHQPVYADMSAQVHVKAVLESINLMRALDTEGCYG
jgi:hypothetical protein